ncbi:uncharacterized protein DSM5745_07651 [Aspergillus mulundensis]|uniref:DUF8035 domain-containing protein n=1 Tax=Aspergillus mulundensis TaxID=1810919 RepID=A0A3D8REK4_9EURO|nr:Uncharacterized protein DSM5745_07651 [Aspergillus mulundensis]RDW72479.1 Uncharacterized protein DSM5745_07651 [Aspergillus mulundensis]
MIDPLRASTGTVQLASSYDPYDPAGRPIYTSYRAEAPFSPTYDPRFPVSPRLEAHPISKQTYHDHGQPTRLRTEYAIRPRQRSSTASAADSHGRLEVPSIPPVSRTSPVILSGHGRSPSPLMDKDGYLIPASSKHHRHHRHTSSFDYASDTGGHSTSRRHYAAYPANGSRRRYPQNGGLRKGEDIDEYDAYSYTNPREQFEKEAAAKLQYHRSARKERPLSLTGIEDPRLMARKDPREHGPPPSHRVFDRMNRSDLRRSTYGPGNSELDLAGVRQRSPRTIALHHDHDEGYSSYRDDHDDRRHIRREHKRPDGDSRNRDTHDSHGPRKSSHKLSAPSVSSNGLGTAVLASGYTDEVDYDLNSRPDRYHHRDRAPRERSRSRRRSRRRGGSESDECSSDDDLKKYRREPSVRPRVNGSDSSKENEPHRHRSRSRHHDRVSEKRSDQKKGDSKDPDAPPKGILKPPRDKFPEEPNPVREGVAPLKDAHKKGIPPGARWTKIDRRLVNPAALEAGQERFEERPDHVIVLRVLTKEEIQTYAVKTQEIRDERYREYIRARRKQREEDRRRGRPVDDFSSDDEDESDNPPLAIEGPGEPRSSQKSSGTKADPADQRGH